MTETLAVDVNRTGLHTLEAPTTFEAGGPFAVALTNHGEPTHVHIHLDDHLSEVARIEASNHYVETDETRHIEVKTRDPTEWPSDLVRGKLKIVTAHGQETHYVDVELDRTPEKEPVEVDPDLSKPQQTENTEISPAMRALPVGVLGAVALILAIGALFAAGSIDLLLGGFAVVAGVACAIAANYLLV
ncbi:MAG: hypothetical protein ACI8U4_002753 [Natronomonas sp.]